MTESALIKLSESIKKEAISLLQHYNLSKDFFSCKDFFIRGSYELDLMIARDIDIYIIDKKIDRIFSVFILNKLIKDNKFNGYIYYDYSINLREGFPRGYYIGLKTFYNNHWWKIDIWFMNQMDEESDSFMKYIKTNINKNNKRVILKMKYIVETKKMNIKSFLIYKAVLNYNIKNIKELKKIKE